MTRTRKPSTTRKPRLDASGIAAHLGAAWHLYSESAGDNGTADPAAHKQTDKLIETLERLLLQIPARDPIGAIAQLALVKQELDTLSSPGPNWVPPDWSTVADVVGVAAVVLAKALGLSDMPVLREYCYCYGKDASYPDTLCRVGKGVGI